MQKSVIFTILTAVTFKSKRTLIPVARRKLEDIVMAPKRKRSSLATTASIKDTPITVPVASTYTPHPPPKRQRPLRTNSKLATNPDEYSQIRDGPDAARASPGGDGNGALAPALLKQTEEEDSPLSDVPEIKQPAKKRGKKAVNGVPVNVDALAKSITKSGVEGVDDPEAKGEEEADEEEIKEALSRPPPVNSDYLPLPWKGRLGYVWLIRYF